MVLAAAGSLFGLAATGSCIVAVVDNAPLSGAITVVIIASGWILYSATVVLAFELLIRRIVMRPTPVEGEPDPRHKRD